MPISVAEAFWRDCVVDGSIFSKWVVNVGRCDALCRLSHLMCEMAIWNERDGLGDRLSFPLPITQMNLGEATGLTNIHVNRTLKQPQNDTIVEFEGGVVTVRNWDKLVSVGDFDPAFLMLAGPVPRVTQKTLSAADDAEELRQTKCTDS